MSQHRKARGMRTQLLVADYMKAHGWPFAESTGASRQGSDVTGVPGLAVEVKARRDLAPKAWLKQAAANPGLPFVVFRPDGVGETTVPTWPCLIRFSDLIDLLHQAGYGTPPADTTTIEGDAHVRQ